jgi:hypothetical protein
MRHFELQASSFKARLFPIHEWLQRAGQHVTLPQANGMRNASQLGGLVASKVFVLLPRGLALGPGVGLTSGDRA